ncbi:U-box domain-containing protein 15-like isoform X2 [Phoenix dactylifera]|uniref:RING-type E3 ubiquitin transferase n=1 Tax=Phoenix dactylifera TaxID=42345 RepID=A0A8B8ZHP7_PHODC|nr:U-box domain-containing protein 15-like isoform X2 [Phoenix dactylifera]
MTTDPVSVSGPLLRVNQICRQSLKSTIGEAEEKVTAMPEEGAVARGGDGGGGGGEGKRLMEREHDQEDLTREMLEVIDTARSFGEFRRTQRKECFNLVRRLQLVAPLLEEIKELETPISDTAFARLCDLAEAFSDAKKLLRCCHDGSKIYLVELMNVQLERAKRRTDTQDMELAMDLMVVLSGEEDLDVDRAVLERLASRLQLQALPDLRAETMAIKKLIKDRCSQNAESTQQIIDLLDRFKQIAGIEDSNGLSEVALPKYLEKCPSLVIPNDFLCPISLEIMTDPVIVATGQTFERRSIQIWLDAGHRTCPKTRQTLSHLSLAPNYALRNLILQWCEKNKVELLKKETDLDSEAADHEEEISSLVEDLSSIHLDKQRRAVKKIRMLSKENPDHRLAIAQNGGIPALVSLLTYPDSKIQENTVTALLNLSIDEGNKKLIAKEGAVPSIIEILKTGTVPAKENSAAALFSLSMLDEIKLMIGNLNGMPPLIDLLQNGTIRGKKDAATALFNLVLNSKNKARAIEAGIIAPVLQVLGETNLGMADEALSILFLLTLHPDGCNAIGQQSFIQTLVEFIKEGTPKNKECALSVLLELGSHNSSLLSAAIQLGVHDHLDEIVKSGTDRAQRKAKALISNCEQVQ